MAVTVIRIANRRSGRLGNRSDVVLDDEKIALSVPDSVLAIMAQMVVHTREFDISA